MKGHTKQTNARTHARTHTQRRLCVWKTTMTQQTYRFCCCFWRSVAPKKSLKEAAVSLRAEAQKRRTAGCSVWRPLNHWPFRKDKKHEAEREGVISERAIGGKSAYKGWRSLRHRRQTASTVIDERHSPTKYAKQMDPLRSYKAIQNWLKVPVVVIRGRWENQRK